MYMHPHKHSFFKIFFMKIQIQNPSEYVKIQNTKNTLILSTVGFQNISAVAKPKLKSAATDFFEEFKEAIRSGDESLWRMWR